MGLITLLNNPSNFKFYTGQGYSGNGDKSNQTSIPYGKDTLGGGYSGQPYIQTPIPDSFNDLGAREDFILRGGINAVRDSLTDIKRLGKMFIDTKSPNGLLFIAKQQLLSRTAVRTQTSGVLNEFAYSPLNTLAQAGLVAFGNHLKKQGINPFAETGAYAEGVNNENLYNVKVKSTQLLAENRLVLLYSGSLLGENKSYNINGLKLNDGQNVMVYTGGPGSQLGIGNTTIRFADQRTGLNNRLAKLSGANKNYFYGKDQQRSVNISNQQVGGLKIEPFKPWTWSGPKIITPYTTYDLSNFLPSFDVNKPQSGSLSQILDGEKTWTSNKNNSDSVKYYQNLFLTQDKNGFGAKGSSGIYNKLTTAFPKNLINDRFNGNNGIQVNTYGHNVYNPISGSNTWPKNNLLINAQNTYTYNQQDIIQTEDNTGILTSSPTIQDFRDILRANANKNPQTIPSGSATIAGQLAESLDYKTDNFEQRVKIGNPGQRGNNNYSDYAKGVLNKQNPNAGSAYASFGTTPGGLDRINSLPIYRSEEVDKSLPINDFVKFRIAVIDNDSPGFKTFMHFRAFLGPITDSYSSEWNGFNYLGRGEKFYTYGGFDRKISLSWTVAAQSKEELIPMYKKLNYLASTLAPDYSPNGYMRGNLVQLTIGGYLYEQPGFITGLSYEMGDDSPWEIGIGTTKTNPNGDPTVKELTQIIKVSGFNFTPIHNFVPRKQELSFINTNGTTDTNNDTGFVNTYGKERFIALQNGIGPNLNNYDYKG